MAYNWNWGVFLQPTATGGDETYLGWMFYGFKMTIALSLSAWLIALAARRRRRRPADGSEQVAVRVCDRLRRGLSQHSAARATLPLVLRDARVAAREPGQRLQAEQPDRAAVSRFDGLPGAVYQRARRRAGALGDQLAAARAEERRAGDGLHAAADLSLCDAADGRAPDRAAADLRVSQHLQELGVCSTIGLLELAAQGRQLVDYTAQPYESFIAVTIAYLLINVVVMFGMRWVEEHVRVPGYIGGK
jgi:glutamate/aspartate transport system permease protein